MKIKIIFVVIFCTLYDASFGQSKSSTVQSILIYSAIRYMEWPADDQRDFTISVVGESEIYNELVKITQSRKIGNREISIKKVATISGLTNSHLIFLCSSKHTRLDKLIEFIDGGPMLLVTEQDGLLEEGSDLNIIQRGEKIVYQLNEKSLGKKRIKVATAFSNLAERRI